MRVLQWLLLAALLVLPASGAFADDWTAVKLRGVVLELVDGDWQKLARGDVVPDDRFVRTVNGRVTLVRGAETIELGPNTQIQIFDQGGRRPVTTVREHFGTVSVEAEVRQVQHFAVQTPYLVAVVKGTRFVVRSGRTGSDVKVMRGAVEMRGHNGDSVMVLVGQTGKVGMNSSPQVNGLAKKSLQGWSKGNNRNDGEKRADKGEKAEKAEKADKPEKSENEGNGHGSGAGNGKGKGHDGQGGDH